MLEKTEKEARAVKEDILRLCWYMRGSISYNEGMSLSTDDRKIIHKIIEDNIKTTKDSGLPFF